MAVDVATFEVKINTIVTVLKITKGVVVKNLFLETKNSLTSIKRQENAAFKCTKYIN